MRFNQTIQVVGMKASKGTLENGTAYDSTKVYALIDLDTSKGNAKGASATEFNLGTAAEFEAYKHLPFPFVADVEDRKSTRLNSSHGYISYAVFCLKKKKSEPVRRVVCYDTLN